MSVLNRAQMFSYHQQGFLIVSGLIPQELTQIGTDALLEHLKDPTANSEHYRQSLCACYTPEILEAASDLVGDPKDTFQPPSHPFPIISHPSEGEWSWPEAHIDHSIKADGYKTFPRPFRIASMLFLSDVAPHGGGTIVWPGSHLKVEALAKSDPERLELMWTLNQAMLSEIDLGEPVELTPKSGDILFYHYLFAHSGSKNITPNPRLGMNCKW